MHGSLSINPADTDDAETTDQPELALDGVRVDVLRKVFRVNAVYREVDIIRRHPVFIYQVLLDVRAHRDRTLAPVGHAGQYRVDLINAVRRRYEMESHLLREQPADKRRDACVRVNYVELLTTYQPLEPLVALYERGRRLRV